jgi:hypothetical protein
MRSKRPPRKMKAPPTKSLQVSPRTRVTVSRGPPLTPDLSSLIMQGPLRRWFCESFSWVMGLYDKMVSGLGMRKTEDQIRADNETTGKEAIHTPNAKTLTRRPFAVPRRTPHPNKGTLSHSLDQVRGVEATEQPMSEMNAEAVAVERSLRVDKKQPGDEKNESQHTHHDDDGERTDDDMTPQDSSLPPPYSDTTGNHIPADYESLGDEVMSTSNTKTGASAVLPFAAPPTPHTKREPARTIFGQELDMEGNDNSAIDFKTELNLTGKEKEKSLHALERSPPPTPRHQPGSIEGGGLQADEDQPTPPAPKTPGRSDSSTTRDAALPPPAPKRQYNTRQASRGHQATKPPPARQEKRGRNQTNLFDGEEVGGGIATEFQRQSDGEKGGRRRGNPVKGTWQLKAKGPASAPASGSDADEEKQA